MSTSSRHLLLIGLCCQLLGACVFDRGGILYFGEIDQGTLDVDTTSSDTLPLDSRPRCLDEECTYGCRQVGDRCKRLNPSNIDPSSLYDRAVGLLTLRGMVEIDTTRGTINGQAPPAGVIFAHQNQRDSTVRAAVFAMNQLRIEPGAQVRAVGAHPLILYLRDDALIAGRLEVSGRGAQPGPGGRFGGAKDGANGEPCLGAGSGGRNGGTTFEAEGGGGGGGWGGAGGNGSTGFCPPIPAGGGGRGGGSADVSGLSPLIGGCGGGAGGGPDLLTLGDTHGGAGGGAGGALQISADQAIILRKTGIINAGGGGGRVGGDNAGGGGGGSGGSILLEAAQVTLEGKVAANGGAGGGGGSALPGTKSGSGSDGSADSVPALGGKGLGTGTSGGGGAIGETAAADGALSNGLQCNGGGGGGGVGVVMVKANKVEGQSSPAFRTLPLPPGPW